VVGALACSKASTRSSWTDPKPRPVHESRVPHISLVFREMWDTTALGPEIFSGADRLDVEVRGIPHLAKNERDMGHPGFVALQKLELQPRLALWSPFDVTHRMIMVVGEENQPLLRDRPA
jgi:hypothetical protein